MAECKLTPLIQQRLCELLKKGRPRETACAACRISSRTLRNWIERGEKGEEPFVEFALAIAEAESHFEGDILDKLQEAIPDDFRAASFLLERRFPKRWGSRQTIEHEVGAVSLAAITGIKSAVDSNDLGDDVD